MDKTKRKEGLGMDVLKLPRYMIDIDRLLQELSYGKVEMLSVVKANNNVIKMAVRAKNSLRFNKTDDAILYLVDALRTLPADKTGEIVFKVEHRGERVLSIEAVRDIETNYTQEKES